MISIFLYSLLLSQISSIFGLGEIIFALNAGGDSVVDSNGIRYRKDYLTEGVASDYGRSLDIKRVNGQDKLIYQTERYSTETFGYNIPMPTMDGDYVLWLKFSEVWFNAPNQKVFDIALNDVIVVKDLDIFASVGRGVAHDEVVPFQVRQNKLIIDGKGYQFNGEIRVDFIKTGYDNPKINAIIVMKGTADQVPNLPEYIPQKPKFDEDEEEEYNKENTEENNEEDEEEAELRRKMRSQMNEEHEEEEARTNRKKKVYTQTEQTVVDPYAMDETSYLIPILFTLGAFIPLLFCLCKLR